MECKVVKKMIVLSAFPLHRTNWQVELSSSRPQLEKKLVFQEKDVKKNLLEKSQEQRIKYRNVAWRRWRGDNKRPARSKGEKAIIPLLFEDEDVEGWRDEKTAEWWMWRHEEDRGVGWQE